MGDEISITSKSLKALQEQTEQFFACCSDINNAKAKKIFGFGKGKNSSISSDNTRVEYLGWSETGKDKDALTMEDLYHTLHGKSQRGKCAFATKHLVTVSEDHKLWWVTYLSVNSSMNCDAGVEPRGLMKRLNVNWITSLLKSLCHDLVFNWIHSTLTVYVRGQSWIWNN